MLKFNNIPDGTNDKTDFTVQKREIFLLIETVPYESFIKF